MKPEDIHIEFVKELIQKFIEEMGGSVSQEQVMRDYEYVLKNWAGWDDLEFDLDDTRRWEYAFYLMRADINCRAVIIK